jgi:hypothetical protein
MVHDGVSIRGRDRVDLKKAVSDSIDQVTLPVKQPLPMLLGVIDQDCFRR